MRVLIASAQRPDSTGSGVFLAEMTRSYLSLDYDVAVLAGVDGDEIPNLPFGAEFYPVRYNMPDLSFPICGMSDLMPYESTRYRDMTPEMVKQFEEVFTAVFKEAIDTFKPDVIILHHLYLMMAVLMELNPDCPVAAISHSTDLRQVQAHDLCRERIINAARKLDLVFALHETQREELIETYGLDPEKVVVTGTGYNSDIFHSKLNSVDDKEAAMREHLVRISRPFTISYAGKIWKKKGLCPLFNSLSHLPYGKNELVLKIAGGYSDEQEYNEIVNEARKAPYRIDFLGTLPQEDLADLYRSSSIFVLPSFSEGLPLVVIEAIACGSAVVLTDLPGLREWFDAHIPNAPIFYVKPPRMKNLDEPLEEDLPIFEEELARTMHKALNYSFEFAARVPIDTSHLTWKALCRAMLEKLLAKQEQE